MAAKKRRPTGSNHIPVAAPYSPPPVKAPVSSSGSSLQTLLLAGGGVVLLSLAVLLGVLLSRSGKTDGMADGKEQVVREDEPLTAPPGPVARQEPRPDDTDRWEPRPPVAKEQAPVVEPPEEKSPVASEAKPDDMKEPDETEPADAGPPVKTVKTTKDGNVTTTEQEAGDLKIKVIEKVTKETVSKPLQSRLAVSRRHYDDMGKLLEQLGAGYKYTELDDTDLHNAGTLSKFDVVFLTCSTSGNALPELASALREYVNHGGTLYASDIRFDALARAFPEYLNPVGKSRNGQGQQNVLAAVKDAGLKEVLGSEVKLHFNAGGWRPASFNRQKVSVLLEGRYETNVGTASFAPLLVKFNHGEGTVIFTSFHNEAQNSDTEKKLLEYLVFTVVTSEIETSVKKTMISGGFSPQESRRIGISLDQPKAAAVYKNKKAGPLRFTLGFRDEGAKLQLTLTSPTGQKIEREGTSTFSVEVDNAAAGDWQYTITALTIPYQNFPFTLTVGEADDARKEKKK